MKSNTGTTNQTSLRTHLLLESKAMAEYALSEGLWVETATMVALERMLIQNSTAGGPEQSEQVSPEGHGCPASPPDLRGLTVVHNALARLVAPASPGTILLLATESSRMSWSGFLGPVRLIRAMTLVALLSLAGFILVTLSPSVDGKPESLSLVANNGLPLLLNILFLLTSASLGASFFNLFKANRYLNSMTYNPRYESSYWVRYVLGVVSGTIVGFLLQINPTTLGSAGSVIGGGGIQPIIAMTGGFSSAIFYRFLNQLVVAFDILVTGDARDLLAAQSEAAKARLTEERNRDRFSLSSKLFQLQKKLRANEPLEAIQGEFDRMQEDLLSAAVEEQPSGYSRKEAAESVNKNETVGS